MGRRDGQSGPWLDLNSLRVLAFLSMGVLGLAAGCPGEQHRDTSGQDRGGVREPVGMAQKGQLAGRGE